MHAPPQECSEILMKSTKKMVQSFHVRQICDECLYVAWLFLCIHTRACARCQATCFVCYARVCILPSCFTHVQSRDSQLSPTQKCSAHSSWYMVKQQPYWRRNYVSRHGYFVYPNRIFFLGEGDYTTKNVEA